MKDLSVLTLSPAGSLRTARPNGADAQSGLPPAGGSYVPPVTAHAVLRYLTRIENFDLKPVLRQLGRDAGNWATARAAAAAFGVDIVEIQKRICPEYLAAAVQGGASRVRREGMVLVCAGGQVISLYADEVKKFRGFSRREIKRGMQRFDRRFR